MNVQIYMFFLNYESFYEKTRQLLFFVLLVTLRLLGFEGLFVGIVVLDVLFLFLRSFRTFGTSRTFLDESPWSPESP